MKKGFADDRQKSMVSNYREPDLAYCRDFHAGVGRADLYDATLPG